MQKLTDSVMTAEATEILGVSENTRRAWARDGKFQMHGNRANGYRLFRRADLNAFLRAIAKPTQESKKVRKTRSANHCYRAGVGSIPDPK